MNAAHEVRQILSELFGVAYESIRDDTGPGDIAQWDSLGHIQVLEALNDRMDGEIPLEQAIEARTVADLVALLKSATPGG
jgi:acyl carrier protein